MTNKHHLAILGLLVLVGLSLCSSYRPAPVSAQNSSHDPTWWSKYEFIRDNGGDAAPLSETFITINQNKPKMLAGGSNEIFRLPMRGYYSTNGGSSWGGVDLPLP